MALMTHPLARELCHPSDGDSFTVLGNRYTVRGKLGDGAVGLVRKAESTRGEQLAVKFLAPDPKYIEESAFDDVRARFKREGERGPKLECYSLLRIHAYSDNIGGSAFDNRGPTNPFLLMERSSGGALEDFVRRIPIEARGKLVVDKTRLSIAVQIAEALEYLHARKLIHRDVKPANIFLSGKPLENHSVRAKLGDFGVVKWGDFHASLATGTLTATMHKGLGTFKYMAPEAALKPKDVDNKTDVFSFGITLYELFTGQLLTSPHHAFALMSCNDSRGTTTSRFAEVGTSISAEDEPLCTLLLDMVRRGVTRRPTMKVVRGRLEYEYEKRFDSAWSRPAE